MGMSLGAIVSFYHLLVKKLNTGCRCLNSTAAAGVQALLFFYFLCFTLYYGMLQSEFSDAGAFASTGVASFPTRDKFRNRGLTVYTIAECHAALYLPFYLTIFRFSSFTVTSVRDATPCQRPANALPPFFLFLLLFFYS